MTSPSETAHELAAGQGKEGPMASQTIALGERVVNFPLGFADDRWTVVGEVVELYDAESFRVVGVDSFGDSVDFVADAAKTRKAGL